MPYTNITEGINSASHLNNLLPNAIGIEVGYAASSSQALSPLVEYTMDINNYKTFKDVELVIGDATKANLSGLDFIISLGLPAFSMKTAKKVLLNAAKHNVKYVIFSPAINEPEPYKEYVVKKISKEKKLHFYKIK